MQDNLTERLNERAGGRFAFLKLKKIDVDISRTLTAESVCRVNYIYPDGYDFPDEQRAEAAALTKELLGLNMKVEVSFTVSHIDKNYLKKDIIHCLSRHPSAMALLGEDDISVEVGAGETEVRLNFIKPLYDFAVSAGTVKELEHYLAENYCTAPRVTLHMRDELKEEEKEIFEGATASETVHCVSERPVAGIDVREVSPFIGGMIEDRPRRIRDMGSPIADIALCGRIEERRCFDIKNGKNPEGRHVFNFMINDGTGSIKTLFFSKPDNDQRAQTLKEGDKIIAKGNLERDEFNGRVTLVFKARAIGLCEIIPPDLTPVKNPPPEKYKTIFPKKVVDFRQDDLFSGAGAEAVSEYFAGKSFVVFDVETTGLLASDKIIELSAYKVTDGRITEAFDTLIDPKTPITAEITKITTITDADVAGAPVIDDVIGDFYKFTDGCTLVAHNIAFDHGFLSRAGEKFGYIFDNPQVDTIKLAQANLRGLTRFSLAAVCAHLGIKNEQAHRAASDAYATAQVLLKIAG